MDSCARFKSELPVSRRIDHFRSELRIGNHVGWVEFSQAETNREHSAQFLIDVLLRQQAFFQRFGKRDRVGTVVEIAPG